MKIKTILSLCLIFLFSLFAPFLQASAHVLMVDKNIGAILHINPDDDPIAGQQSTFFFEFKDKENKFNPKNCACNFTISEDGTIIYAQPLFQNNINPSLQNASVFYTFPRKDVYQIKVIGKPTTANSFQAFNITYNIRVDRTTSNHVTNITIKTMLPFFIIIIGIIIFIVLIEKNKINNTKKNKQKGEKKI